MPTSQSTKSAKNARAAADVKRAEAAAHPQIVPAAPEKKLAAPSADEARVVRDGFTMPQGDYDILKALKAQCLKSGVEVKKSELLRAGVQALAALPAAKLLERMRALPAVKAGRKKSKA